MLALSSLGNPERFEELLEELGAEIVPARYPDHHAYTRAELEREITRAREVGCSMVITTEKDAVKIEPEWPSGMQVYVLPVEMEFDSGQGALEALIEAVVAPGAEEEE